MKKTFQGPTSTLLIVSMITALFLQGSPCFAATSAGALPWDQTLTALQDVIENMLSEATPPIARRLREKTPPGCGSAEPHLPVPSLSL